MEETERGVLKDGDPHPAAKIALKWIRDNYSYQELMLQLEAFSSCAIEGNRLSEILGETLRRLLNNEPISDRYIMGLSWYLFDNKQSEINEEVECGGCGKKINKSKMHPETCVCYECYAKQHLSW